MSGQGAHGHCPPNLVSLQPGAGPSHWLSSHLLHGGKRKKAQMPGERVRPSRSQPRGPAAPASRGTLTGSPPLQTLLAGSPCTPGSVASAQPCTPSCQETAVAGGQGNGESLGVGQARGVCRRESTQPGCRCPKAGRGGESPSLRGEGGREARAGPHPLPFPQRPKPNTRLPAHARPTTSTGQARKRLLACSAPGGSLGQTEK